MRKIYGFLAVFLIAAGGTAWADDITADVLTYDGKAKTVTATGNVVIHANEGAVVTGKKGQYYFENRSAWLDGGVEYQKDQTVMTAEKMYLYEDKTTRGVGGVYIHDEAEKRTMKGDDIMYNPETGFMQPRDEKGIFINGFDAKDYTTHITESNGWQYFWYVPQNIEGLIGLTGGADRFAQKLDSMFTYAPDAKDDLPIFSTGMIGQYAHGNEPSHHVIYLFNAVKQPWKTQEYTAKVMHELYLNTPAGLCGNEDCGQMSAWYVFSAMGFYPVNPIFDVSLLPK